MNVAKLPDSLYFFWVEQRYHASMDMNPAINPHHCLTDLLHAYLTHVRHTPRTWSSPLTHEAS